MSIDKNPGTPGHPAPTPGGPTQGSATTGPCANGPSRQEPRSKREVEDARHQLQLETARQIDELAAEYHARLPREKARQTGAAYARYSSRFQHSIADQVRGLFEAAVQRGVFIPREHVYFDLAVRGCKEERPGLDGLRALLGRGGLDVLLIFTTNRLFRKTYKALQFVEEEVVERGIRCLFVKSGVDSADTQRWRMLLQIHAMTDEFIVGMYAENIRAAHEGLFDRRLVCGTLSYGYAGEPIAGEFTRLKRPRCRLVIDPVTAGWVRQVFNWFVTDLLPLDEIARRLNADPSIPLPPKATTGQWTHQAVRGILSNPRYRGWWQYGVTESVWQSKKDYNRQLRRAEPLRSGLFEDLRIVPDSIWYGAEKRRAEQDHMAAGRKPRAGAPRPKVLHGLFRCPVHDRILYVGGSHGHYLYCPACRRMTAAERPLYSQLPRELALRRTCEALAGLVRQDEDLVAQVIAACREEAVRLQAPDPARLEALRQREQKLSRQIQFLLVDAGETEADRLESARVLQALRCQRAGTVAELECLRGGGHDVAIPTEQEVRDLLGQLGQILAAAVDPEAHQERAAARAVLRILTGGRIELYQQGERRPQRGWLQGRFRVRLLPYLLEQVSGSKEAGLQGPGVEMVIDYRELAQEEEVERAKQLYDRGLLNQQIAAALGCGRNWVTKLLHRWFAARGLAMPDGRKRRATLPRKQGSAARYEQLADEAKGLWDEGLADVQIATRLGCSPPTVAAAVAHWHASRGLPAPSQAARRAALVDRMQGLYEEGRMIREIAREVKMCSRSVTLLLRERFASLGRSMPNGRQRRAVLKRKPGGAEELPGDALPGRLRRHDPPEFAGAAPGPQAKH
jgi:DNA invertase Pin-like site-specific DNA recombinase